MAYNLQSLITILEQILNPEQSRWIHFQNIPQLQSLYEKAESLQQILEKSSLSKIKSLENKIRDATLRAEDIIEPLMVDQMLSLPQGISFTLLAPDLQKVTQELDYVMKQVMKLEEKNKMLSESSSKITASFTSSKSVAVGVDEDLMQLKDRLTGMERKLDIIPITGMGGIGKTTLALNLYQDPLIVEHFEILAWTTISQDYNMKTIISSLLCCIVGVEYDYESKDKSKSVDLRDILHKSLYSRRFMIVLDDIWSTKFWDEIRRYLPDNNNGSRIVITTRESNVAEYANSWSLEHRVQLLTKSKSWDLLRQIVFGEDDCPNDELQWIGKKIASDCNGLPLAINVIGGVLSKVQRSKQVWMSIAENVRAAIGESKEHCSSILYLSYNHLSNHLRPCFLYMGAFPEDYVIRGSKLVRMWIGEGFVKSNGNKSFEEVGEDYLKNLVERNLLLVKESHLNGKPKSFSMHDLLRDLCITIAKEDKFLSHGPTIFTKSSKPFLVRFLPSSCSLHNGYDTISSKPRRVCFLPSSYSLDNGYDTMEMMSGVRSFMSTETLSPELSAFRLLRVLDILQVPFEEFPTQVLQLVNLRYLAIYCRPGNLPVGISRLCNLQTLIANLGWGSGRVPCEIWEMSELRHIKLDQVLRLEEDDMNQKYFLKKLQTLSRVGIHESPMWKDFFQRFPDIKKLAIHYVEEWGGVLDISHLCKLEKLRCNFQYRADLSKIRFPSSLKSLTLDSGSICSTTLCQLPNLEVLIISRCTFETEETKDEWVLGEDDEFRSLRFLLLDCCDLVHWTADETNFPTLRRLSLLDCWVMEEIPSGIGEISTLQLIELRNCSAIVVASAKQIQHVQQSDYDNYDLQIRINDWDRQLLVAKRYK